MAERITERAGGHRDWRLVDPVASFPDFTAPAAQGLAKDGNAVVVGFLSNRKQNTTRLQKRLGDLLVASDAIRVADIQYHEKDSTGERVGEGILAALARCDLVINGTGD